MTPELNLKFELDLTLALCKKIDTPRSLTVAILLREGEFDQYLDLDIDPRFYQNPSDFAEDYLVTKIMSKSCVLPTSWDTRSRAIDSFIESESHCRLTNDRLLALDHHPWWFGRFRRLIRRILGPLDHRSLEKIQDLCRHGPGGSVGVKAEGMCRSDKFDAIPTVTPELLPYAASLMGEPWSEYRPHLRQVAGSQFFTVPKNAKTDRACATEPTVNQYLQLGIGGYIARRLRYFGVDITDQTVNQFWASQAQKLGLATLDLSSASDLISVGLVFIALPPEWRQLLSLARSRVCKMQPGEDPILLEKFSTMGNGFTFALETLLFYACVRSVCGDEAIVSAYGDDLIVPQVDAHACVDALEFLGFKVNGAKSCLAGNFFESCGTDWFEGTNVRPFFLRKAPDDLVPYNVSAANALRIWSNQRLLGFGCDGRFHGIWQGLVKASPFLWQRCRVPLHAGDVGFISSRDEYNGRSVSREYHRERFRYRRIRTSPSTREKRTFGVLLAGLTGVGAMDVPSYGREPMRGIYRLSRPGWAYCDSWPDGLGWIH